MKLTRSMLLSIKINNVFESETKYKIYFSVYGTDEDHFIEVYKTGKVTASFDVDFGINAVLEKSRKDARLATYFLGMLLEHNKLDAEQTIIVQDARNFIQTYL